MALDPSRIAAQIVTGAGFLGAGVIFVRGQDISGLTTAAGISMAVGSGLYLPGVPGTALIFLPRLFLHRHFTWPRAPSMERLLPAYRRLRRAGRSARACASA
ncbi:MgtC/SapB family protein [uncultured Desulfovibrio sp.]|uniref:MgtC/SapB family protein n=1 Tax=uncultured Desulfovibrio sp. TaxID=167968 RepID=UPI0026345B50|nr:MgtC/SapB family protein [uncultured Desulfovibrio sp.]